MRRSGACPPLWGNCRWREAVVLGAELARAPREGAPRQAAADQRRRAEAAPQRARGPGCPASRPASCTASRAASQPALSQSEVPNGSDERLRSARRVPRARAVLGRAATGSKLKDPIPNLTPICQPNHQNLEGSFASASKPIFTPKHASFSIFRELLVQDL